MESDLKNLIKQKDDIEKEIAQLTQAIEAIDEVKNFNKNLTDSEGFPRADIDFGELANYRNLKRKKAQLNNDHFVLMKEIQQKLHVLHASYSQDEKFQISETHQSKNTHQNFKKNKKQEENIEEKKPVKIDYLTPFAKVSIVFEGSPSETAGLMVGDLLSEFDEINIYSLDWQKQIPGVVKQGIALKVVVMRKVDPEYKNEKQVFELKDGSNYRKMNLLLTPGRWQGRGLLGCKIDPITS